MSWNELSLKDKADYIKESVNNGIYNLSDIRNRYNMYANGGYKPSESIKKRITNWEGSSMRTNRSFQAEANDFNRVIPSSIRSKLSQQQLDALYSYGYNVGMGNLKKRVLPTLTNYVQGKASNEDVQKSMWASKDNELRGLTTRRNIERSLFGGKYQTVFTGTGGTPHNYGYTTTNRSSSNPYQIQNEEWQGKNYLGAYKGLQLSMNDIMGKTKETDINDLISTGIGPTISMDNLLSIGNNNVAPVQPDYSYAKSLLSDFDSDLNSNIFAEGGNMDNNRTAMPAHPATNPYKRRSWETDEEYKERIQDLDNKSQEAALNDSTATNKYKEWKANIQKQQKINEEKSKAITIEKNTKRAETLEKEFNSLRNIPSQMSPNDTIQAINKNIPEAYKQQYINNINMYKPALDTIDLGINLYSLYNPTVPVLSAGLLTNGLQFGQSIVDEDLGATDYSALAFDTLGLLGATNKLPTRLRISKNRFWDIDKTADYLGAGQNILDSAGDVYDLSKTGYHLYNNNKGSNNLYISPFKKSFDEGGNLNFIDADNRRSNILLHTEDGNLYDSAGNNYTQSYLDEEHVPIIKGTMPRNTRQYYDPNTTLEFINAATAPISNFSPSNIVGSIREARDYNTFMNSFMNQDNTGFFTREYAKEHPYISALGNLGGDILAGAAFDKGIDILRDFKANSLLYKKGLTKLRSLSKKLGYRPNFNRYNNILYDYTYGYSTIGNLADRMTENLANKNKDLFYIQKRLGSDSELQGLKDYYAKYATRLTDTQKEAISRRYGDKAVQLMSDNPEYFKFIRENPTLNPFEQSTVDAFFRRQGLSLRGVHSNNPIQAQKFLTETEYGRVMPGGDRLNTNGGLYTSNSRDIGNRFKNPEVGTEDGYIAELFHDWGIDKSLPIEEQLYQQRQKVLYDLAHTKGPKGILYPLNPSVNSKAYTKLRENPVLEAIESEYMRSSGETLAANERAYLPIKGIEGTKGKPVNIEKVDFYPSQENQRGRWGSGNIDDTLFINKELNNTTDFIRDARILLSNVPVKNKEQFEKAFKEINERMSKRVDKYEQLRDKVSKIQDKFNDAKLVTIGLSGVPLTAAGTYGIYKYDTNNNLEVIEHELRVDDRYHRMNKIARKDFEDAYKRISGKDWKVK